MFASVPAMSQARLRAYDPPMADKRVERLYTLPLEEFTGARNELAKELRAAGDREAADRVKALRKPSRSAWGINRLRQEDRAVLRSALKAGQQLRSAQSGALSGASGEKLRERARAERKAVAAAAERAAQIEPGLTERDRARIRATLHAGAGDDEIRAEIESGRLTIDHEPVGLGPLEGTPGGGAAPRPAKPPPPREDSRRLTQARGRGADGETRARGGRAQPGEAPERGAPSAGGAPGGGRATRGRAGGGGRGTPSASADGSAGWPSRGRSG